MPAIPFSDEHCIAMYFNLIVQTNLTLRSLIADKKKPTTKYDRFLKYGVP